MTAIPITYNLRNLRLRIGATAMTALGIALTVAIAIMILALLSGLRQAFASSGDPLNVLVLRKGSEAEMQSFFSHDTFNTIKSLPGIQRGDDGQPLVSGEMIVAIVLPRRDGTGDVNVTLRGMTPMGLAMRPKIKITEGRWWQPGHREVVVSESVHKRFAGAELGDQIRFGKGWWTVVGVFDSHGSAHESEIWADVHQMATDFGYTGGYSSALIRAIDHDTARHLSDRMSDDARLKLSGMLETKYYADQTKSGAPIQFVGTIVAIIMAVGSCFAAMNTMYAAVAYRSREIATLRTIGFSRRSILTSFVIEAVLLSLIGAALGIALMLPFNGVTTGTSNQVTFSEVVFSIRITTSVVLTAITFAVFMGLIGGLAPAWHASRQDILAALRD